jgi:hypothetical protein
MKYYYSSAALARGNEHLPNAKFESVAQNHQSQAVAPSFCVSVGQEFHPMITHRMPMLL